MTRLKDNAFWVVVETRPVPADSNIRGDEIIVLTQHATEDNENFFRGVGLVGREKPARVRLLNQPSAPGRCHRRRRLQGSLASTALLQEHQTEPADQNLRRHIGQRAQDPNLDSIDCLAAAPVPATTFPSPMAHQTLHRLAAQATLCLP